MSIWDRSGEDGIWLVGVTGRLEQTQTPQLEDTLTRLLQEGKNRLIIDLAEATYINSGGLRCLVTAWRQAKEQGGNLYLCCLAPRVREVFNMVGFDRVFQIFPDQEEAIRAWQQAQ